MPTFKAVVFHHQIKYDKTVRIKIRVTHNRESKYIDSGFVASIEDLTKVAKTKTYKIKNEFFIDETNLIIKSYRDKCNKAVQAVSNMSCSQLVEFLSETAAPNKLDFIQFSDLHIEKVKAAGRLTTARDYQTAINALKRFANSDKLPVSEITSKFLKEFADWIPKNPINLKKNKVTTMSRAVSHYLGSIRTLYNEMKLQYNDEENGIITIPGSPFVKYKVPKPQATKKRAILPEQIKKIFELPDLPRKGNPKARRFNLAKDCFMLSFLLIGMNSADLFDCTDLKDGKLTYKRKKTRRRRGDEAEICVFILPEAEPLIEKYKDTTGKRVFNFYQHYSNESNFNAAINKGLKEIELGLEFYSARHSWATIALNKAGIDKYTVHAALNHVEDSMKVTDVYLEKDWNVINEANRKVINYVLQIHTPK